LNADDKACLELTKCTNAQIMKYGLNNEEAEFTAKNISYDDNRFCGV